MSAGAAPTKKGSWVLVQNGIESSTHLVTVSRDAVKVVSGKYGYHVVFSAPKWEIHCFRPKEKIEWVGKLDSFNGNRLFSPFANGYANRTPLTVYGKGQLKGVKVTKYSEDRAPKSLIYGADELPVSPQIAEFLCRYFDVPVIEKVPLYHCTDKGYKPPPRRKGDSWSFQEIATDLRQGVVVDLSTVSWKAVPYNPADYQFPSGLAKVTSPQQVAYTSGQKEMFTDFLDGVGLSTEQKGSKETAGRAPVILQRKQQK